MKKVKGVVISGSGEAALFTQLDWVKQQCREKLGFEPYPGTLNLRVREEDLALMSRLIREGIKLVPPTPNFCEAVCLRVTIDKIKGAVILPHVDNYYQNTVEIIAPVKIKESLSVEDGDEVVITIWHRFEDVQGVIFDLDGTLIDSLGLYFTIMKEVWRRVGLPTPPRDKVLKILVKGQPFWEHWDELVPPDLENKEAMKERCQEVDREIWEKIYNPEDVPLIPGVVDTLLALKREGISLGLVTSSWGREFIAPSFERGGIALEQAFSAIVTRFDAPRTKPFPDPLLECANRLGIPIANCIYVGDSPSDIIAGKAAGAKTVAVLTGVGEYETLAKEGPNAIIPSVADLPKLLP